MEGAALDYEAQVMEKMLALTLKAAKDLHQVNCKALITFKLPQHSSFKSNAQVQAMLQIGGFWLMGTSDGAVHGLANNRRGGVMPQKGMVVLVSGLGDDLRKDMSKCAGHKCRMVVPSTAHHAVVLC